MTTLRVVEDMEENMLLPETAPAIVPAELLAEAEPDECAEVLEADEPAASVVGAVTGTATWTALIMSAPFSAMP